MKLHKEQERICRDLGNVDSLQISLGNPVLILKACGDLDGAMTLHKEEEQICRDLGNVEVLAQSLAHQTFILVRQDRRAEAVRTIDEAYAIASAAGYGPLVAQIREIGYDSPYHRRLEPTRFLTRYAFFCRYYTSILRFAD